MNTNKLIAATLCSAIAVSAIAAEETTGPKTLMERAAENRKLVSRYSDSIGFVRYFTKKNAEGVEPKFEIPYKCPNCSSTHWRDDGVSVEKGIPAEFSCFVISPDEVAIQDAYIDPAFIDRIEVVVAGEKVRATESEACPDANALILKTEKPLSKAKPLSFTGGGEPAKPRYFYIAKETADYVSGISESSRGDFRHHILSDVDIYSGNPNTVVLDENGDAVTLSFKTEHFLGEEMFDPPAKWRREKASARWDRRAALEAEIKKSVLPVYIQLEAPPKEGSGGRMHFSFSSDDDVSGNDIDAGGILIGDKIIVPIKLDAKTTARLVKIEATLPDGKKAPMEFVGSLAERGGMIVKFKGEVPAGLKPLKIDTRSPLAHFGKKLDGVILANKSGSLEVKCGKTEISKFVRTGCDKFSFKTTRLLGIPESGRDPKGLFLSDKGLVALTLPQRHTERYNDDDELLGDESLVELLENPVFDPENVPRLASDRKRTPWLGVEVQTASAEVLREKKATSHFRSYESRNAALVTAVAENSPAAKIGIKEGDVLISAKYPGGDEKNLRTESDRFMGIDWTEIFGDDRFIEAGNSGLVTPWENVESGVNAVLAENFAVGSEVIVAWVTDGKRKEAKCTLALAPVHYSNAPRKRNKKLGLTVCDMTYEVRKYFKFDDKAPGVVVSKVKSGGTAAVAGIRPLEIILEVNGEGVVSAQDFIDKTKDKKDLTFKVRRLTNTRMVPIKTDASGDDSKE